MKKIKHVSVTETNKLKRLCKKYKITQGRLAQMMGLSIWTTNKWFLGNRYPLKTEKFKENLLGTFQYINLNDFSEEKEVENEDVLKERALQELKRENQIKSFTDGKSYNWKNESEKNEFYVRNRGREDCRDMFYPVNNKTEETLRHLHSIRAHFMDSVNDLDELLNKMEHKV